VGGDPHARDQPSGAVFATQAIQRDPNLLFRRVLLLAGALDVSDEKTVALNDFI